jgi:hypothetical protein
MKKAEANARKTQREVVPGTRARAPSTMEMDRVSHMVRTKR